MLTLTGSRLFRFLLSLIIRLRLSVGRIGLALGARFASLWRSILTPARHGGQSQVRLHANNVPVVGDNSTEEHPQIPAQEINVDQEAGGTLAALPVRRPARWEDELAKHQDPASSNQFEYAPYPATPEGAAQRYKPKGVSRSDGPLSIPAGQHTLLSALPPLPKDWERHVHPEGNVLFHHEGLRIFTESNITNELNCKEILFYATTLIQRAIVTNGVIMDELTEIVLNVDDDRRWYYYFVDHRHRLLFWVHPINLREDLGTDLEGITGYDHIRYLVESHYWYGPSSSSPGMSTYVVFYFGTDLNSSIFYDMKSRSHCEFYPHNRTLPKGVFEGLRGMLNYTKTDMMTNDSSSSLFAQNELVAIMDLVNSMKDSIKYHGEISGPHNIWVIARLMAFFTEDQFMNFCGQHCARLNADTTLFGQQTWNHGILFNLVNAFLLGSPNEHAGRLQHVWVDGTMTSPRWKDFIKRLTTELGWYPIFSTVILAVNFSFLVVPGVVTPGSPASATQIMIYCSIVSTIGSIVFSFALSNIYSDPALMNAGPVAEVMKTLDQSKLGMACLAITHSLPIACLIWSIILFSAALAVQIFLPMELATRTALGVECLILVLFGYMSYLAIRLFFRNEVDNVSLFPIGFQHDVEPV